MSNTTSAPTPSNTTNALTPSSTTSAPTSKDSDNIDAHVAVIVILALVLYYFIYYVHRWLKKLNPSKPFGAFLQYIYCPAAVCHLGCADCCTGCCVSEQGNRNVKIRSAELFPQRELMQRDARMQQNASMFSRGQHSAQQQNAQASFYVYQTQQQGSQPQQQLPSAPPLPRVPPAAPAVQSFNANQMFTLEQRKEIDRLKKTIRAEIDEGEVRYNTEKNYVTLKRFVEFLKRCGVDDATATRAGGSIYDFIDQYHGNNDGKVSYAEINKWLNYNETFQPVAKVPEDKINVLLRV